MVQTKDLFKKKVIEIQNQPWWRESVGFGIARVDLGQLNQEKVLHATYLVTNWLENYGSQAILMQVALDTGYTPKIFNGKEVVIDINSEFIECAMEYFNPYIEEAKGEKHKNVQAIMTLMDLVNLWEEYHSELENNENDKREKECYQNKIEDLDECLDNLKLVIIFEGLDEKNKDFIDPIPESVESIYLRLYALSTGKAKLREVNLNGAFGKLHNIAWSGNYPYELDYLRENEMILKATGGYPTIDMVDKFPRFLSHIIPADNTRILDASKVRFGAQLAAGTTVMPGASYINFNAGTLGPVMAEGRISSSAIVGSGSDVGGGASILGVLSGTDGNPITIGENTLLGANSTTGISLGDGCIIDGGLAVFAGTKFTISDEQIEKIKEANPKAKLKNVMKAAELSGLNGLHFRQDSQTGQYIVMRSTREVKLNEELH